MFISFCVWNKIKGLDSHIEYWFSCTTESRERYLGYGCCNTSSYVDRVSPRLLSFSVSSTTEPKLSLLTTPWSTAFLEKMIVSWLVKKFPRLMDTLGSLPLSQEPATYSILGNINPLHTLPTVFLEIHFDIILPSTHRSSKWSFFSPVSNQNLYEPILSPIHVTCPAQLILKLAVSFFFPSHL